MGPGEILYMTPNGVEVKQEPGEEMKNLFVSMGLLWLSDQYL